MKQSPLISIIIAVHNVEPFLHECLDSVLGQTYTSWNAILVDDASTDLSGQICDEYARRDERFIVVHKSVNENSNRARETGANRARETGAKYVSSVDSDDILHEKYLESLIHELENGVDIVRCGYKKFWTSAPEMELLENRNLIEIETKDKVLGGFFELQGYEKIGVSFWGGGYRIELLENLDWDWSNSPVNNDVFLMMQIYSKITKLRKIDESLYFYRQTNPSSISKEFIKTFDGKTENRWHWQQLAYNKWYDFLRHKQIPDFENKFAAMKILYNYQCLATAVDVKYDVNKIKDIIFDVLEFDRLHKNNKYVTKRCRFLHTLLRIAGLHGFRVVRKMYLWKLKLSEFHTLQHVK